MKKPFKWWIVPLVPLLLVLTPLILLFIVMGLFLILSVNMICDIFGYDIPKDPWGFFEAFNPNSR